MSTPDTFEAFLAALARFREGGLTDEEYDAAAQALGTAFHAEMDRVRSEMAVQAARFAERQSELGAAWEQVIRFALNEERTPGMETAGQDTP